jgi:regulator of protease activity HflC (stomatin/prohibitin superfamily)
MMTSGEVKAAVAVTGIAILLICTVPCGGCIVKPYYDVWQQGMAGKAKLAEADSSRQIAVAEARAKKEAATMLAEAEIERAKGVAEANRIIGESLAGHDEYLRYLWITGLESNNPTVIYVPTEAGLPILEAHRLDESK